MITTDRVIVHRTLNRVKLSDIDAAKAEAEKTEKMISELLIIACDKAWHSIHEKGYRNVDVANAIATTPSALMKSLNHSFSMRTAIVDDFCGILFPGESIDHFLWGKNVSMPALNVDVTYLKIMEKLSDQDRHLILDVVNKLPLGNDTPYSRFWTAAYDRFMVDPILDRFKSIPETQNLAKLNFKPQKGKDLHVRTLMEACVYCNLNLEFLLRQDYAGGEFTVKQGRKTVLLNIAQKRILRRFAGLSLHDKSAVIVEAGRLLKNH